MADHLDHGCLRSRKSFLSCFILTWLPDSTPNNAKHAATCHPQALHQVFQIEVLSLRTEVRDQRRDPVSVEKDANEETQKATPDCGVGQELAGDPGP